MPALTKKEMRPKTLREVGLGDLAARLDFVEHGDPGRERVGDLLHRRRPRLLQVVAADVGRVPARHLVDGEGDHVGDQPHRGLRREGVGAAREVLLDDVVLGRALQLGAVDPVLLGDGDVEAEQPGGGGVDRHRGVHLVERDPVEQLVHVALVGDRDADLADLAAGEDVVGVIAGLGRQVEGDREAGLALGQVAPVELVGAAGVGVAGVGAHHPGAVALGQSVLGHGINDICRVPGKDSVHPSRGASFRRSLCLGCSDDESCELQPFPSVARAGGAGRWPRAPRPRR